MYQVIIAEFSFFLMFSWQAIYKPLHCLKNSKTFSLSAVVNHRICIYASEATDPCRSNISDICSIISSLYNFWVKETFLSFLTYNKHYISSPENNRKTWKLSLRMLVLITLNHSYSSLTIMSWLWFATQIYSKYFLPNTLILIVWTQLLRQTEKCKMSLKDKLLNMPMQKKVAKRFLLFDFISLQNI